MEFIPSPPQEPPPPQKKTSNHTQQTPNNSINNNNNQNFRATKSSFASELKDKVLTSARSVRRRHTKRKKRCSFPRLVHMSPAARCWLPLGKSENMDVSMSQKIIMNEAKKQNPLPPSIQYMHGCCSSPGCPRLWRRKSALVLLLFGPRTHNKTHKLQFPPPLDALSSRDQKQRASLCPKPELSLTASPADQSQPRQRGTSVQRANEERGGKKGGQLIDLLLTFSHTLPRIGHF